MRGWHNKYGDQGLVVIGNHYPEFSYERDLDNLKEALLRLDVPYAVAQDNDRKTWRAYRNRYWPTLYLIDKRGHIRYVHIGEGAYEETELAIQALLAEAYNFRPAWFRPIGQVARSANLRARTPSILLNRILRAMVRTYKRKGASRREINQAKAIAYRIRKAMAEHLKAG